MARNLPEIHRRGGPDHDVIVVSAAAMVITYDPRGVPG